MAYRKKKGENKEFERLKEALAARRIGRAYLFHGEEAYLRDHYLGMLHAALVPEAVDAFNYHRLEGRDLTVQRLTEAAEAMPMMADRTLCVAVDYDIFRLPGEERDRLCALLEDLPEWCCLVFLYDTIPYQPNRTMKKLCKALDANVETVEFRAQEEGELLPWIGRQFREMGKEIDRQTAEYLIFTCGNLMTALLPEIEKIGAYVQGKVVTRQDIDAVADPIPSTEAFRLSDAVLDGNYDRAAAILGDLLKMQQEPIYLLAIIGGQLRRIYTARIAIEQGRDRRWLKELWGMRSEYPAKLLLSAARRATLSWCEEAVRSCEELDRRMKSESGIDQEGELKLLLVRLAAGRASSAWGGRT